MIALLTLLCWRSDAFADRQQVLDQLRRAQDKYTTKEQWDKRRAEIREGFLKGARLWPLPDRVPLKVIRHSRREYGDYSVENVALETLPGFYCTGNLYRPTKAKSAGPGILCPHGHFKPLGRFREEHQIRCAHFARMGATVFSYSMVGWQDSQQTTHEDPLVLALQTWNSIRVVDFLSNLDGVDPRRIGATGASGGGTQSLYIALVDERVKASAPVVIVYPWAAPENCCVCEGGLPVMQAAQTNAIETAASIAPRAQLLISVGKDETRDFPSVGFPFIKRMYQLISHGDHVENVHFADEEHDYGPSKRKAAYPFFAKHLGMKLLDEDLTKITIEKPEQMEVFSTKHPLPANAVKGAAEVAKAFEQLTARVVVPIVLDRSARSAQRTLPDAAGDYSFKEAGPADEALIFTPPGFKKVGVPAIARGDNMGKVQIVVRDKATGKPTLCRVNVVGPDGNYYEPKENYLTPYSLTGEWPKAKGWGNRQGKAPIRYLGRYFYCNGGATVDVPAGAVRVEVWKGFEYRPQTVKTEVTSASAQQVTISLERTVPMAGQGYYSGDPHIHMNRESDADDQLILDLLEAEDIRFGPILAYNEPPGPYAGVMKTMTAPQYRGLGGKSVRSRDGYHIISGQEYRSGTYGHMNLFLLDRLVMEGQSVQANDWPLYGHIARDARSLGGLAFYAHGGYALEIYADLVQGNIDGVELLQFGVYRGIGLSDWYRILNCGFRFPAIAASDYPACRKLGDCQTYVHSEKPPDFPGWLRGAAAGRSFVTTGPMLLLEVDGQKPGAQINKTGPSPHRLNAQVRVTCEVTPVTNLQLIVNGRVEKEVPLEPAQQMGKWSEFRFPVELRESGWIAARAFSLSRNGTPDAESHTNPVYVYGNGRAPYDRASLDTLIQRIDQQIANHRGRSFREKARVLAYFERARDILLKIRQAGGAPAKGHPSDIARDISTLPDPGTRTHSEAELKEFLKPIPPKPIDEFMKSIETVDGFRMELVAREPLVYDPIAAAFDEHGNLYVAEMRDYPYVPKLGRKPLGAVHLLKDKDGDGRFDESHVFADGLLWAAGIAPWKGGVYVTAPPDIWYFKDTDGDGKADVRQKVYTGFGTQNQQAMLNNLQWGLDHKIYGSTAGNGGMVRPGDQPDAKPIAVHGRDFRFDPVTGRFETITGTLQFGNTFDDWGNRFLCTESQPTKHAVLPEHYLARNPYLPVPEAIHDVAPGPVPIFRISPIERWRQIRSGRRITHHERPAISAGVSHHVIDAAAGVTVYRGGAYPKQYYGNVFVPDAQNNLVHRRILTPDGVTFRSKRADERTEFVRSSDNWFRPVNLVNAPDGTLYVLDMSREIIEAIHIPLDVVKHLDLRSGRDHGRIFRLAPPGFRYPGPPTLGRATTAELVAALESPHGWYRDTAHRLIYERQDQAAVEPLRRLLRESSLPQARLHALWSLHGLKAVTDGDIEQALRDASPEVKEHGIRLAEPRLDDAPRLLERVFAFAADLRPRIRLQLAFTLGETKNPSRIDAWRQIALPSASDRWIRTAMVSSSAECADQFLVQLLPERPFASSESGILLLEQLASVVGARNRPAEVDRVLEAVAGEATSLAQRLVVALGSGLKRSGGHLDMDSGKGRRTLKGAPTKDAPTKLLRQLFDQACRTSEDRSASESARRHAIELLSCFSLAKTRPVLARLIDIQQPESVQIAAVRALASYANGDIADALLPLWRSYTPAVREEVLRALLGHSARTARLLDAIEASRVSVADLDATHRELLRKHADSAIRDRAEKMLARETSTSRKEIIESYKAALALKGDIARGRKVFQQNCMACHRVAGEGYTIGAALSSASVADGPAVLTHILDPNHVVQPQYTQYVALDKSGRMFTGVIATQTATSVSLKRENGATDTILRSNLEDLSNTGKSLMPEGLEQKIDKQSMADLIAFLQKSLAGTVAADAPLDIGTEPGLVEPDN